MGNIPYKGWLTSFFVAFFIIGVALILAATGSCERKQSEEGAYWPPPDSIRIGPHTNIIPMDESGKWSRISIDCTNDFDGTRLGHDTKIILAPDETIEVQYIAGWCSYFDPDYHKIDDKKWGQAVPSGGFALTESDVQAGKRIRYPNIHGGYLAVLVILRTESGEENVQKFANGKTMKITNPFSEPTKLFFFFNGLESFYNQFGEKEDGFKYNGIKDNARVVFDIYR